MSHPHFGLTVTRKSIVSWQYSPDRRDHEGDIRVMQQHARGFIRAVPVTLILIVKYGYPEFNMRCQGRVNEPCGIFCAHRRHAKAPDSFPEFTGMLMPVLTSKV